MTELLPEEPEPEPEPDTKPMDVEGEGEGAAKEGAGAKGGEDASAEKKKEEPTAEAPAAPKKKVRHTELRITPMLTYTHTEKVKLFYEREGQMAAQDRLIVETGEAKNDVESYVYDTRSKIGEYGVLHDYTPEEGKRRSASCSMTLWKLAVRGRGRRYQECARDQVESAEGDWRPY